MRQDPDGYARSCDALADAAAGRHVDDRLPDAARHRRRGCGRAAAGGAADGRADAPGRRVQSRCCAAAGTGRRSRCPTNARTCCGASYARTADERRMEKAMANVLFTNVRIIDGTGAPPFPGRGAGAGQPHPARRRAARARCPTASVTVIDGAGATLMPGMVEAHTHFSWNDAATLDEIQRMPLEEHVLWSAHVAKRYLEAGFTSCVGAALREGAARRRDHANAINEGPIPGPRYLAASQEITVAGGARRRDAAAPAVAGVQLRHHRQRARGDAQVGAHVPQVRRRLDQAQPVRRQLRPRRRAPTRLDDRRGGRGRGARGEDARQARLAAHARSCASVKQCVRHGIEVIYHASFADDEALDMLEARKDRHFVAPGIAILYAMLNEARGVRHHAPKAIAMGYQIELEAAALESLKKMHKRGIRVLPGGDYGFALTPHGQNARDLEFFVKYLGMTPMEAILSATKLGGADHDAGRRARPDQGGLPRRPAARRRRSAVATSRSCASRTNCSRS